MQILTFPDPPIRNLEWYKVRYEGLREDIAKEVSRYEELSQENKSLRKYIDTIQEQLSASKDLIDTLWDCLDELNPNENNRITHDE